MEFQYLLNVMNFKPTEMLIFYMQSQLFSPTRSDLFLGMLPFRMEMLIFAERDNIKSDRNLNIPNRIRMLLENSTRLMLRDDNVSVGMQILFQRD